MSLELQNLHISAGGKPIVKGLSLILKKGEVQAIMGPNGSGKSTLANTLMGHPKYKITSGKIILDGKDITSLSTEKRAKLGLFLSMQYPPEIPGVTLANFLRVATQSLSPSLGGKGLRLPAATSTKVGGEGSPKLNPIAFHKILLEKMNTLGINPEFATRHLNTGFSGGEKKKS